MTLEESEAEADRILSEAGWTTTLKPPWNGRHVAPGLVGGRAPDGNAYAKAYTAFAQSEAAAMGLDPALYPDEPHEAAAVLVASVLVTQPEASETPQDETHGETVQTADDATPEDAIRDGDQGGSSAGGPDGGARAEQSGGDADAEERRDDPGGVFDADFEPIPDLPEIELIPPDSDPDFGAELLEFEGELSEPKAQETAQGPIAYAASDFDALIREKTGRVSQIARGLKADLQEGWTLDEYASLQNQIVMMDRGQMPDDPAARERFVSISQMSQAMSRVDAVRDAKEAALEDIGQRRNYADATAFDPESDWP